MGIGDSCCARRNPAWKVPVPVLGSRADVQPWACCQHSVSGNLSTGRAGLRDQWDSSYRQELPPVLRLPSLHVLPSLEPCIPSTASTGILHCDPRWGELGSDAVLSCLASGGMLSPCPIPLSPQRNKEHPLLLYSQISMPAPLPWKLSCLSGC